MSDPQDLDLDDIPDFNPKRVKRAVRRGLVKTAAIVLAALVVAAGVLVGVPMLIQQSGDRQERMMDVLGTAFQLYNPSYQITELWCCDVTPWSLSIEVGARPLQAIGGFEVNPAARYTITQDLFGRVGRLPLGNSGATTLTRALMMVGRDPVNKKRDQELLAGLPQNLRTLAVVEFTKPMTADELAAFGKGVNACPDRLVMESRPGSVPITWGYGMWSKGMVKQKSRYCYDSPPTTVAAFRAWRGILRDEDGSDLRHFDLTLARIEAAAQKGLMYAYVDETATVAELRKAAADPRVKTVRVADATFDVVRF
ncbi:hypothetical protein [Nonomuraea longicatena]|uniref:Uncharacterized protein n=1 Tax=Nonomuraea longicatena TaxID=83682 RepID=A0ABN1PG05_9ACTN